ncbi:hypothetical protein JRO89_XS12G0245200 [Xanthoceras sorbifolium]|uniref:Knottins-like domain-containing protein n=1 Tax=Xanthoceras sorbifolium TaxID=99658 RepID=A0ABQ8HDP4_9ROSI|nr:hypothetical protein JRO89_XS12G0245200 [Xanthoceras sorbifolium]
MERNLLGLSFTLLILFISEEVVRTQARLCYSESTTFKGLCISSHSCAMTCISEGFTDGKRTRWRRRCMCSKECGGPPLYQPPPYGDPPPPFNQYVN